MIKTKTGRSEINILFTCIGRRVSLLNNFRRAAKELRIKSLVFGTDTTELSSALQLCDKGFIVKPTKHADYIGQLLAIVKSDKVRLLVPTVDLDLKLLARNKAKFEKLGCRVLISSPEVVDICQDKRQMYRFLRRNGFDTPVTKSARAALRKKRIEWPVFLKPWDGYASKGTAVVHNRSELTCLSKRIPNCIAQEFIKGTEYTCDVYVDFDMKVRCVVPRRRIEVRSGEVSKAQTVKNSHIMKEAAKLVEKLGAGPGVITIQLFLTSDNKIKIIEINPRFGGGVPLSIKAGADFAKWVLQEVLDKRPQIGFGDFSDKLIMLRYDGEVWLEGEMNRGVK